MNINIINCNNFLKNLIFSYLTKINKDYIFFVNDITIKNILLFREEFDEKEKYINNEIIVTYSELKSNNFFSFYEYFKIIGFEPESSDKMFFLANALNNFILLKLKLTVEYPIILDPIQSIKQLLITNNSLSRFGDGELYTTYKGVAPYDENVEMLKKEFIQILNEKNNTNLYIGLCDIFNDKCKVFWDKNEYLYWFTDKWRIMIKNLIPEEKYGHIYLNANISRIHHYPIIEPIKYFEYYCDLFLNKEIIVICNKDILFKHLDNLLFPAKKITFIIIKDKKCSIDEKFIYDNCILYGKNKLILAFAGLFATYLSSKLSKVEGYRCIDSGSFYWNRTNFSRNFIYSIDNIINKFYYKINSNLEYTDNNDYNKLKDCFILDEFKSLNFNLKLDSIIIPSFKINFLLPEYMQNFNKIKCQIYIKKNSDLEYTNNNKLKSCYISDKDTSVDLNLKIESIIKPTFQIHFILPSYLKNFNKVKCCISIKTNIVFIINTGIDIIEVDKVFDGYLYFNFKDFEWYIEPKNYLDNDIKIDEITLKIIEIYDCN